MKTAFALLVLVSSAHADPTPPERRDVVRVHELVPTCVAIDTDHDALPPSERAAAARTLARVLEEAELLVVETGCTDVYTVRHEQASDGLIVHLGGPRGSRRLRARDANALAAAYRAAVTSLYGSQAPSTAPAPPLPPVAAPVPADVLPTQVDALAEPRPARVPAAGGVMVYGSLGIAPTASADTATEVGAGVRVEHAGLMVDVAGELLSSGDGSRSVRARRIGGRITRVLQPDAEVSPYAGGGLALGTTTIEGQSSTLSGGGVEATGTFGVDFARDHRGARVFAELAIIAPLYKVGDDTWAPSALVRVGIGQ